jgi:arginase family enzyme
MTPNPEWNVQDLSAAFASPRIRRYVERAPGNLDHASWVNRAAQLSRVKKIIQLGQRGLANHEEAMTNAHKANTMVITAEQIHRKGVEWVLAQISRVGNIYITLGVDVMDPTLAPGTGTIRARCTEFQRDRWTAEGRHVEEAIGRNGRCR